jgi:oxygen-dependent protoporphyrinogen oxidase
MKIAIIGGGISGLSLAYALLQKGKDIDVNVFEGDGRPGGKIFTERTEGYVCEAGVNGFLDNKPATLDLARQINLPPLRSNDSSRIRYVYFDGALRKLPATPGAFFLSDFLSLSGRLRMIGEYFVPKSNLDDETMESFAKRRVGTEFFEKLLDPMASGVYAGDPTKMSIRSCFNKVYDLEQRYGGLIKGFMALGKEAKRAGKKVEAGPGGTLMSFTGGMYSLIETLATGLGARLATGKRAQGLEKTAGGYRVHFGDGSDYEAETVILACPAHDTAGIIKDFDRAIYDLVADMHYPSLSVVSFGFRKEKFSGDLDLFGFLIPGKEKRRILGTLFDSSIFPGRAPEGHVLIRSMIGGARAEHLADQSDEKLVSTAREELSHIIGFRAEPEFQRIYRWEKAIPQYHVGHYKRLEALDAASAKHKGFYLAGNAYRGVAVNDCIGNGFRLAEEIVQQSMK